MSLDTERRPAECFPVGVFVRDELEERGWTPERLAERSGLPLANVQRILDGALITPGVTMALHRALGLGPVFWSNLNEAYVKWLTVGVGDGA